MAVIPFPQHDLPPDLLNSRISGASVDQCNDILFGEFFADDAPAGVTGSAHVDASVAAGAAGNKAVTRSAADSIVSSVAASGKKTASGQALCDASAWLAANGKMAASGTASGLIAASLFAGGTKGSVEGVPEAAQVALSAQGAKSAQSVADVHAVTSIAASGAAYIAPPNVDGTAAASGAAALSLAGVKGVAGQSSQHVTVESAVVGFKASLASITAGADCAIDSGGFMGAAGLAELFAIASIHVPAPIKASEVRFYLASSRRDASASRQEQSAQICSARMSALVAASTRQHVVSGLERSVDHEAS